MYMLGTKKVVAATMVAGSLAVAGTATAATGARTFVGTTAQSPCAHEDSPLCGLVNVQMARGLRSVKNLKVFWEAPCDSGKGAYVSGFTTVSRMPLGGSKHRKFRKVGQLQDDLGDGLTGVADVSVSGTVNKKRTKAKGTFELTENVFQDGQQVDTCSTGSIRWSAAQLRK